MYYVLYDYSDNILYYFDNVKDVSNCLFLRVKDINYKFKHSSDNFIQFDIDNVRYKLYCFNEVDYET